MAAATTTNTAAARLLASAGGSLTLYTSRICPFAQRTTIALHDLGLIDAIEPTPTNPNGASLVEIDLANKPEWYTATINPRGKVPALKLGSGGPILIESALIAEYLYQAAGRTDRLLTNPEDAHTRYAASRVTEAINDAFVPAFYALLREHDTEQQPAATAKLLSAVHDVGAVLDAEGPYAVGSEWSVADTLAAPFLARLVVLKHYRGFDLKDASTARDENSARFVRWATALLEREAVKQTTAPAESLVVAYAKYAGPPRV
ncbi:glutathione S-transferase domain-containing protein [Allomyces macrogynus ATCC 38327]|uniref:Glutathione S-transferase domain-containing protein n=1 Tax=Allomyces macrogynus (strain ATCC 38327) TaxID=578462 RepID=A0A0L0SYV1_ALLM3|nr:glutathione S-transferase domain-containing protein [Allomyces macrogynus ATCC 38327]|eukprot:KNE67686.1 glutathione S-transferase domain-containing protein [Allomyces macrogynus ATCC 38327]